MADMAETVAKTRNTLLERIEAIAAGETDPGRLRALAEAFAFVVADQKES